MVRLAAGLLALLTSACGTAHRAAPPRASASPSGPAVEASTRAPGPGRGSGVPAFGHVFVLVMENLGYDQAIRLPYVSTLAERYAVATHYDAVAHPSLPNYLALTSGRTWVTSDCTACYVDAPNLAAQAVAAGVTWGAYMEGLPGPCWFGPSWPAGRYAGKHDPFRYYLGVRRSRDLCDRIQPLTALEPLLAGADPRAVPRLVWITPDLCHDGHDCPPATADRWLQTFVPKILASAAWREGGVLLLTWDEAEGGDAAGCCGSERGGGHVLTLVVAPGLPPGLRIAEPYNHYSLLATVEEGLGLPLLGHAADPQVRPMSAFWTSGPAGTAPSSTPAAG